MFEFACPLHRPRPDTFWQVGTAARRRKLGDQPAGGFDHELERVAGPPILPKPAPPAGTMPAICPTPLSSLSRAPAHPKSCENSRVIGGVLTLKPLARAEVAWWAKLGSASGLARAPLLARYHDDKANSGSPPCQPGLHAVGGLRDRSTRSPGPDARCSEGTQGSAGQADRGSPQIASLALPMRGSLLGPYPRSSPARSPRNAQRRRSGRDPADTDRQGMTHRPEPASQSGLGFHPNHEGLAPARSTFGQSGDDRSDERPSDASAGCCFCGRPGRHAAGWI